ncbi:MAG: hypothetical protein R6W90_10715 [Ignavibacteriaceae bacterium]
MINLRKNRIYELEQQVNRFTAYNERLKKLSKTFSWIRLGIFLSGVTFFLILFFFTSNIPAYFSAVVFITAFGIAVMKHNKIDFAIRKCLIWIKLKQSNIARIKIDWENIPYPVSILPDSSHPFESDLNICGRKSLLHLINVSVSEEGTLKLRELLTQQMPDYDSIIKRQHLVKELLPLVRFRDKLRLNSQLTYSRKKEGKLLELLNESANLQTLKKILTSLIIIIPINIILFLLFLVFNIPAYFSIGLLIQVAIYWFNSRKVGELFERADDIKDELGKFSRILEFLEKYPYGKNENLKKICTPFLDEKNKPSKIFRQINRTILALSLQKNPITMLMFNIAFPWAFYHAYRLEKFKKEIKVKLPEWLNAWYSLEAVISLANFGYINPDYTFPEIDHDKENTIFSAEALGHPLIPFQNNIKNEFNFAKIGESVIITGSNMSGKSTFLKTIGLNLCLSYAGGPVVASKLDTSLFRIYTCINISDSVTDGISYFYAEVKRLKKMLDELETENDTPLFYLIDEIFRGTNNLERLTGSRSYIKKIAGSHSIGLISTHDLELVKLEQEISNISNYHFKEEVIGDKMVFDYKIHPGPCPTTNALKIMKLEGLPVDN